MKVESKVNIEFEKIYTEYLDLFKQYLRIDTTNPPGNEILAANFFKKLFDKEGIESTIYESAPGRGSILATLKGTGEKKPIVLLNHMDVVPVDVDKWNFPPFEAEEKDGYIYCRGAQDMKNLGFIEAMTMILMKRSGYIPNRDIIFLGCADEEAGGTYGMEYLVKNVPLLKEVDFCINEGSSIKRTDSGQLIWEVAFSEKVPSRFYVRAKGTPGHGSVPIQDNCNNKLVKAMDRLNNWETPIDIIPIVRSNFKSMSKLEEEPMKSILANIDEAVKDPQTLKLLIEKYPSINALIRDTLSLTIMKSGYKENVIPCEGYAFYDARILPGHSRSDFIDSVKELLKDLPVEIQAEDQSRPAPEKVLENEDSEFYQALRKVAEEMTPGSLVIPSIMMGASDSQYFRIIGVPSYGFEPIISTDEEHSRIHGNNERISIENMKFGLRALCRVIELTTSS
jgi:acetylornithine deacetylase/succinyl-diaminopimelate desuccinylase-like protein